MAAEVADPVLLTYRSCLMLSLRRLVSETAECAALLAKPQFLTHRLLRLMALRLQSAFMTPPRLADVLTPRLKAGPMPPTYLNFHYRKLCRLLQSGVRCVAAMQVVDVDSAMFAIEAPVGLLGALWTCYEPMRATVGWSLQVALSGFLPTNRLFTDRLTAVYGPLRVNVDEDEEDEDTKGDDDDDYNIRTTTAPTTTTTTTTTAAATTAAPPAARRRRSLRTAAAASASDGSSALLTTCGGGRKSTSSLNQPGQSTAAAAWPWSIWCLPPQQQEQQQQQQVAAKSHLQGPHRQCASGVPQAASSHQSSSHQPSQQPQQQQQQRRAAASSSSVSGIPYLRAPLTPQGPSAARLGLTSPAKPDPQGPLPGGWIPMDADLVEALDEAPSVNNECRRCGRSNATAASLSSSSAAAAPPRRCCCYNDNYNSGGNQHHQVPSSSSSSSWAPPLKSPRGGRCEHQGHPHPSLHAMMSPTGRPSRCACTGVPAGVAAGAHTNAFGLHSHSSGSSMMMSRQHHHHGIMGVADCSSSSGNGNGNGNAAVGDLRLYGPVVRLLLHTSVLLQRPAHVPLVIGALSLSIDFLCARRAFALRRGLLATLFDAASLLLCDGPRWGLFFPDSPSLATAAAAAAAAAAASTRSQHHPVGPPQTNKQLLEHTASSKGPRDDHKEAEARRLPSHGRSRVLLAKK
eukprot:GHVU01189779.1.p1 GENE.GHVU01189779.1~~GHVU01189779.1.p1  ORF type:complete len:772 (+),score=179.85 GHVU01189779.1:262-2316(+)